MWKGPDEDPGGSGGTSSGSAQNQELLDLKDQFEQQQTLIAQLKEMLRKSEQTSVTPEKVEAYANTLTKMRAKKSRKKNEDEKSSEIGVPGSKRFSGSEPTTANEKILLLRQKLEENK